MMGGNRVVRLHVGVVGHMNNRRQHRAILVTALLATPEPLRSIRIQQREEKQVRIPLHAAHLLALVVLAEAVPFRRHVDGSHANGSSLSSRSRSFFAHPTARSRSTNVLAMLRSPFRRICASTPYSPWKRNSALQVTSPFCTDQRGSPGLGRHLGAGLWVQRRESSVTIRECNRERDKAGHGLRFCTQDTNAPLIHDLHQRCLHGQGTIERHAYVTTHGAAGAACQTAGRADRTDKAGR